MEDNIIDEIKAVEEYTERQEAARIERYEKYELLSSALDDFLCGKLHKISIMTVIELLFDPPNVTPEMIDWAKSVIKEKYNK